MAKRSNQSFLSEKNGLGTDTPVVPLGLFDAAPIGADMASGNEVPETGAAPSQIVFIERSVADYQILAGGVKPGVKVVVLNPDANGVQRIADYLQQHDVQDLDAVPIAADGADGEPQLGTTPLSASNVASYRAQLGQPPGQAAAWWRG